MATRRTDGMSDDGLSYSVATDFDKQLAQAAAEFDARAKSPRFVPGARDENPDAVDVLQRTLLDPVIQSQAAYQGHGTGGRVARQAANRIVSDRGNIWSVDPMTGQARQVVTAPVKPPAEKKITRAQEYVLDDLNDALKGYRKRLMDLGNPTTEKGIAERFDLENKIVGLQRDRNKRLKEFGGNPDPVATTQAAPIATTPAPTAPTPALPPGKVVIQKGQRFQINPDGSTTHLGPVTR